MVKHRGKGWGLRLNHFLQLSTYEVQQKPSGLLEFLWILRDIWLGRVEV